MPKISFKPIELEIIKLIYQEHSSQEIADMVGKSKRTIDGHRANIIQKIGCRSIIGVVKYAVAYRLVEKPTQKSYSLK